MAGAGVVDAVLAAMWPYLKPGAAVDVAGAARSHVRRPALRTNVPGVDVRADWCWQVLDDGYDADPVGVALKMLGAVHAAPAAGRGRARGEPVRRVTARRPGHAGAGGAVGGAGWATHRPDGSRGHGGCSGFSWGPAPAPSCTSSTPHGVAPPGRTRPAGAAVHRPAARGHVLPYQSCSCLCSYSYGPAVPMQRGGAKWRVLACTLCPSTGGPGRAPAGRAGSAGVWRTMPQRDAGDRHVICFMDSIKVDVRTKGYLAWTCWWRTSTGSIRATAKTHEFPVRSLCHGSEVMQLGVAPGSTKVKLDAQNRRASCNLRSRRIACAATGRSSCWTSAVLTGRVWCWWV